MAKLATMQCTPCREGGTPLGEEKIAELHKDVPEWEVVERDDIKRLERTFSFPDFESALAFTNDVGEMAEEQGHHPRIVTEWGSVTLTWWTHKIGGLHQNDFIAAAKSDEIYTNYQEA
ncbi:MAG: 4a-hydroxytetrahydrobiopterin dehydratase [Anaerolineae bacterium]